MPLMSLRSLPLLLCFLPLVFSVEFLVAVGKDESTGKKGVGFDPSVIHPAYGDIITFQFTSGTHSVVESSFDHPCTPNGQFDSGAKTVPDNLSVDSPDLPVVKFFVSNITPLWFFDQAGGLCKQGAVLAVNPTMDQNATAFKQNAANDATATSASPSGTDNTASSTGLAPSSSATGSKTANVAFKNNAALNSVGLVFLSLLGLV
ncbi:hypothetical protein AX17_003033 [Amanita inopinata Kibby_2008]|nr:hypothetical protein AX17_003033 [Amanita inopinata Kibby_2008]